MFAHSALNLHIYAIRDDVYSSMIKYLDAVQVEIY